MSFSEPVADGSSNFFELPGEKMVGAFNDHQPLRLAHSCEDGFDVFA